MRPTRFVIGLAAAFAVACQDHYGPKSPGSTRSDDFQDASHRDDVTLELGNPHFYLLPPFVSEPNLTEETFLTGLTVNVDIDETTGQNGEWSFPDQFGNPRCQDEDIDDIKATEVTDLQAYGILWPTRNYPNVGPPCVYRLKVRLFGKVLGFADVQILTWGTAQNKQTGEFIHWPDDWTLPFWFFIGQGAVLFAVTGEDGCPPGTDCVETIVRPGEKTVVSTAEKDAVWAFDGDEISEPIVATITRLLDKSTPGQGHLGTSDFQYQPQFDFSATTLTGEEVLQLRQPSRVAVCFVDENAFPDSKFRPPFPPTTVVLAKGGTNETFARLRRVDVSDLIAAGALDCAGTDVILADVAARARGSRNAAWLALLEQVVPLAGGIFAPRAAHASAVVMTDALGGSLSDLRGTPVGPVDAPDLIVESLTHSPQNPNTLDLITFTAVVKNTGPGSAEASTLEFRIGGETPGTPGTRFSVPALAANATFTVRRELTLGVAQNYRNTATADVDDVVVEWNESNNVTTEDYTVTQPPDLIVESLTHDPQNPTTVDLITFTAVVKNIGVGPARTTTLEFRIGGETPGTAPTQFALPALVAGETFTVVRQAMLTAQGYQNTAVADVNDDVPETDETNNTAIDLYTVAPGVRVTVHSFALDVAAGNTGVLEQACPAGTSPTGGGFHFPNSNLIQGPDVIVIESSPRVTVPGTTGWRVVANNRTGTTQRMEVWVACGANLSGYAVQSFGQDVVAGNTGILEQACPAGTNPMGGGFHFPESNLMQGPDVIAIESSPRVTVQGTTGWRVAANNRTAVPQPMEVWVVCAANLSGYATLSFTQNVGAGTTGVLERACPAGTNPTGGGFHFPESNLMQGPDVIAIESSPRVTAQGTTGWRVAANNRTAVTQRMDVWVACAVVSS